VLENQCTKLQEQVTTAHVLLADERHVLDRKLSALLPDGLSGVEKQPRSDGERKTIGS